MAESAASPRRLSAPSSSLDPTWFFVAFAVAIPLSPEFSAFGYSKVRLTDLLLVPTIVAFMGAAATTRRQERLRGGAPAFGHPVLTAMVVVLGWDLLRLVLIQGPEPLREGQFDLGMTYLVKRAEYFTTFFLGMLVARTPGQLQRVLGKFYLAAPLMNLIVVWQFAHHSGDEPYRASGLVAAQPNSTGMFIVANLTIALCLLPASRTRLERGAMLASILTGVAALLATGSREGVVCLVVAVLMVAAMYRALTVPNLVMLAFFCLCAWQFAPEQIQERLVSIPQEFDLAARGVVGEANLAVDSGHSSLAARLNIAQDVLNSVYPGSPLVGFGTAFYPLGVLDNTYLAELIYNGLVGLVLFAWLIVTLWKLTSEGMRVGKGDVMTTCFARAMRISLVVVLLGGAAMEVFFVIRPMEAFFLFMGLLAGQVSLAEVPRGFRGRRATKD